jgi:hypothetical protein
MFKALGALVLLYAVYAAVTGEVYAKSGVGGRTVSRDDSPRYFWVVVVIYLGLGLAMTLYF